MFGPIMNAETGNTIINVASVMSPKAWKESFSEFHRSYSPRSGQRFSFRSSDKYRHGTLSRESSTLAVSPQSPTFESSLSKSRDPDEGSTHSEIHSVSAEEETAAETAGNVAGEDSQQVEGEKATKKEESKSQPPAESDNKEADEKAAPSESSSELNNSYESESLELQLCAAGNSTLHIEETEDSSVDLNTSKPNGLENGEVSGPNDVSSPHKVCHVMSTQLRNGDADFLCVFTIVFCQFFPILYLFPCSLCPI